jgi:hypothetical protein
MDGMPIYSSLLVGLWDREIMARTYDRAFSRCVAPWFIIAGENAEVTPSDELLIVHAKNRVVRIEKIWMKNDLDAIICRIEELHTPDLSENRVARVICHVVRRHGGQGVAFERENAPL